MAAPTVGVAAVLAGSRRVVLVTVPPLPVGLVGLGSPELVDEVDVDMLSSRAKGDGRNDRRRWKTVCVAAAGNVGAAGVGAFCGGSALFTPGGGALPGGICSAVGRTLKRRLNLLLGAAVLLFVADAFVSRSL